MKKIRVAQIGIGHDHATAAILTLKKYSDIFELVGYAVVPEDEGASFKPDFVKGTYSDVPEMTVEEILNYPSLDAVLIETEDRALTKYARLAVERGLAVHMDKPGGIDGDEFDALIDEVERQKTVFHTGYMYRHNPAVKKLREDVRSGKLGEIYAVEAQMNCNHPVSKRNWLGAYPGGMLYYLGCHLIDLVLTFAGDPEEIIPLSTPINTDSVEACDFGMAVFKYKNGVSFVKSTAIEPGGFFRRQLVVCGTKGTVELKPFEWLVQGHPEMVGAQTTGVREIFDFDWHTKGEYHDTEVFDRYGVMLKAFASYVRGDEVNPFTPEYERKLHKIILNACGMEEKYE